jgi:TPR repeat protein
VVQDLNLREAAEWYRKAANQEDAVAQSNLGYCYENGLGVVQDSEEAAEWYRKAADQGAEKAKVRLATIVNV